MSGSYRFLIAAAFGLSLLCAAGFGAYFGALYSPADKQYEAIDAGQATSKTYQGVTESLPDIALIPEPVERAIANPSPNSGQDHEKRDLAAQESMAAWAFYMTLFAGISSLVTFVGTILIWQQVRLTGEAVRDTGSATKAMIKQTEIAETAQTPWIMFDQVRIDFNLSENNQRHAIITLMWKNFGPSPAVKVLCLARTGPKRFTENCIAEWREKNVSDLVNAPGQMFAGVSHLVELGDWFKSDTPRIFQGAVEYQDIAKPNKIRQSKVTVEIDYVSLREPYSIDPAHLNPGMFRTKILASEAR